VPSVCGLQTPREANPGPPINHTNVNTRGDRRTDRRPAGCSQDSVCGTTDAVTMVLEHCSNSNLISSHVNHLRTRYLEYTCWTRHLDPCCYLYTRLKRKMSH